MLASKARELYVALRAAGFNQSRAGRLMGVSRETVRQRLLDAGGFEGLIAKAVEAGLASKEEADALAAAIALAPANLQRANPVDGANGSDGAKSHDFRHLPSVSGAPIFATIMSTMPMGTIPQSSTIRVNGHEREFGKRVALELALKAGLPREDLSQVVSKMIGYFMARGGPERVAEMLLEDPGDEPAEPKRRKKGGDEK